MQSLLHTSGQKQMQTTEMAQRMNTTVNHQQIGHVLAMHDMHQ